MSTGTDRPHPATIYDVARLAGVSHQTVSRVLNGVDGVRPVLRDRVESAVRMLGYRRNEAARSLAGAPSCTVALLAVGQPGVERDGVVHGVHRRAWAAGHVVVAVLLDVTGDEATIEVGRALQVLAGQRPRGIVAVCDAGTAEVVRAALVLRALPSVVVRVAPAADPGTEHADGRGERAVDEVLA